MKRKMIWVAGVALLAIASYMGIGSFSKKTTLSNYLSSYGFRLPPDRVSKNDSFLSQTQAKQFQEQLRAFPHIKSVLEIGFNAGHSANFFLQNCKQLRKLTSVDVNEHAYTIWAIKYLHKHYKNHFEFVEGDSSKAILDYAKRFPKQKFDLIYVDGSRSLCLQDLRNCKELAHSKTIVWVDDFGHPEVQSAIYTLMGQGVLELESVYINKTDQGEHQWARIQYRS